MGEFREFFIELNGQDDNLGDSVLRAAYLDAVRGEGRRFHILVGRETTSDYLSGLSLQPGDTVYSSRRQWAEANFAAAHPVVMANAGEVNRLTYPSPHVAGPMERTASVGGAVIVAGIGLRHPEESAGRIQLSEAARGAAVFSWRDRRSCAATGLGDVAPDWAFARGTATTDWAAADERPYLAVTLRFDRPWPGDVWLAAVRDLAARTGTQIVTLAQVSRDAPRAVRLAELLGGEYLYPDSTSHADLDALARSTYARSLAVVSDRAHGLIIAATEGAYPIGSAANPEKIARMMEMADLEHLIGRYDELAVHGAQLESRLPALAPAIDQARVGVAALTARIQSALSVEMSPA